MHYNYRRVPRLGAVCDNRVTVNKRDTVILYAAMALYILNRLVFKRLDTHGILYGIIHWHLNDYLGEIVFLCYTNILMAANGYSRIVYFVPIMLVVLLCSAAWEFIIPKFISYSTPDLKDCLAYALGGSTYWYFQLPKRRTQSLPHR